MSKPTEDAMRVTLQSDPQELIITTYSEYYNTDPPADTNDMIEAILEAMVSEGSIVRQRTIKLSDIARELGVNPKVARDKLRKSKQPLPNSIKQAGWVFNSADKQTIVNIIKPRKQNEQKL